MCSSGNSKAAQRSMAATAADLKDLSKEALDWYKQVYAEQEPERQAAASRANAISDAQLEGMQFATGQARELDAYNRSTFRPLEQALVESAKTFDTPERRMQAAAEAGATVDNSFSAVQQAQDRSLARMGVAPGSARSLGMQNTTAIEQAKARAGAMTTAVRGVEQQGYARMADAANLGRGLATTQATQQQIATSSGNSSAGNAVTGLNASTSGNQVMGAGFGARMQGLSQAGNLYGDQAAIAAKTDQNAFDNLFAAGSALGGVKIGGSTLGALISDKKAKKGTGRMADTAAMLEEVEATPVEDGWTYKDDPAQTPRTGPMAQEVRRVSGEAAAPGGKVIDIASRMGRMEAAIQELSKRQKAIQRAVA